MATQKINPKLKEKLFSSQPDIVIAAIHRIKEKGNKLYIPLMFELLNSNPKEEVFSKIKKLLETVKDKETVPSFIEAIENKKYKAVRNTILATCWQNGLDFSNYLPLFADIVINEEWEDSFEAFTVIDNLQYLPEQKIVEEVIVKVESAKENASEQKAYFLNEILNKLKQ